MLFWVGRPDLCFGADINGKNEEDAGTHHGASGGHRVGDQMPLAGMNRFRIMREPEPV